MEVNTLSKGSYKIETFIVPKVAALNEGTSELGAESPSLHPPIEDDGEFSDEDAEMMNPLYLVKNRLE